MLFNLTLSRHFPSTQKGEDMTKEKYPDFCFSNGLIPRDNYTDHGRCSSSARCEEFDIGFDEDGLNRLTNRVDGSFTITEIEVWEITG
jgi:hypothetical protein